MKQKLIIPVIVLLILSLSITGCSFSPNDANQGSEPSNSDSSNEIIFLEDEVDPVDSAEEMIFEDAEGILITKNNTPPNGIWLWTNSDPIYEGCPVEMANFAPPADPPLEVRIELIENGETLLIFTGADAVELRRSSFSETASIYEALVAIPITDSDDLKVDYYLDFNVFDDAGIGGTLTSTLPEFEDCQVIRGFSAVYLEP